MREWRDQVRERLVGLSLSPSREQDIVEELSQHLDQRCDELIADGASEDEARTIALNELRGPITLAHHIQLLQQSFVTTPPFRSPLGGLLLQHTRYAVRQLVRYPVFSLVAVLSLVIGVGATTAVFTVFNVSLLQPLSSPDADRLVLLSPERRGDRFVIFNPVYESLRDEQRSLSAMAAISEQPFLKVRFEGETLPTYSRGSLVSGSYSRCWASPRSWAGRSSLRMTSPSGRRGAPSAP